MEFHDFQVRIWAVDQDHAAVLVHSSPAGAMQRPETVLLNWESLNQFKAIFRPAAASALTEVTAAQLKAGGRGLAATAFPDPVPRLLMQSLERVGSDTGLRVRLCLDGNLSDLPWEYLVLPEVTAMDFLALDARVSLVRQPPFPGRQRPKPQRKRQLLFFGTRLCSEGQDLWRTAEEKQKLFAALEPASALLETQATLSNESNCEIALMQATAPMDIFHYSGHTDVQDGMGYLVASDIDSIGQNFIRLYAGKLGSLLRRLDTTLAMFSACNSGSWAFVEPLLRSEIPVVIGVQGVIEVRVAIAFCERLYSALAIGLSLDEAVTWARLHLLEPGVLPDNFEMAVG